MSPVDLMVTDETATCTITGDLDGSATEALDTALDGAMVRGATSLIFDFSGAHYINSTGIGALVGVLKRARENSVSLRAEGLSDHYRHIFEITQLVDFIEIAEEREERVDGHD